MSEAWAWTSRTCPRPPHRFGVVGKGDRGRVVPVGEIALDALDRYVMTVRPAWLGGAQPGTGRVRQVRAASEGRRGGPMFLSLAAGAWDEWRPGGSSFGPQPGRVYPAM